VPPPVAPLFPGAVTSGSGHGDLVPPVPGIDAPVTLRPPAHQVSRTAIAYWALRAGFGWLVLLAIQTIALFADLGNAAPHILVLAITILVAAAHLTIMPLWRYRVHRWEASGQAVYTQAGWFNQERRIAPVSRIQTVDSERGPLEQLFGLANVTVTTASAAGPVKIHGLDLATANWLVAQLTAQTQAVPGDAT
jgi:uncharacterized protein